MKIQFLGAAREVTGSKYLLKVNGKNILFDCGLFQGNKKEARKKNFNFPVDPKKLDAVVLSHAHIDHSGCLPLLTKLGFKGPIYSTFATKDLCRIMLMDSAYIQEREAERLARKNKLDLIMSEPLYETTHVMDCLEQFCGRGYEKTFEVFPGIKCTYYDAGHILGASQVQFDITDSETNETYKLTFTGDLGRKNLPLLKDPVQIPYSNFLITESTYGNRLHESIHEVQKTLTEIVNSTIEKKGRIIIPAFSVERTQEIVFLLNILLKDKKIPNIPIVVDSPLAVKATEVFASHLECFDKETAKEFLNNKLDPFGLDKIRYITDVKDSKALNDTDESMIIISASGMCEFGRIVHHLRNNIFKESTTVLIVGWQAPHTLGRRLLDGHKQVKIFGDPVEVNCRVEKLNAFSGHADRSDLINNIENMEGLKHVFVTHGEESQSENFKQILDELDFDPNCITIPYPGDCIEIGTKEQLENSARNKEKKN